MNAFLQPHQVNFLRQQLNLLVGGFYFVGDNRVLAASRNSIMEQIFETLGPLSAEQRALISEAAQVRDKDEMKRFLQTLEPYVIPMPKITAAEIRKLFPKVKKLVLPDLEKVEWEKLSYLGWRDIGTNTLYLVHHLDGQWVATECKYVIGTKNRSTPCIWCKRALPGDQVGLVTAQVKGRRTSPDFYKTLGNHICLDSASCNEHLTSRVEMEAFLARLR
jgi:hypothetical protein